MAIQSAEEFLYDIAGLSIADQADAITARDDAIRAEERENAAKTAWACIKDQVVARAQPAERAKETK